MFCSGGQRILLGGHGIEEVLNSDMKMVSEVAEMYRKMDSGTIGKNGLWFTNDQQIQWCGDGHL